MDIFLDDLEQVYNRTQIASEEAHQNSSKTGWNNAKLYPSHSMSVLEQTSLGTIICEKSYCFVEALDLDECSGSCVVNTSLMSRYDEYVKTDSYII